MKSQDAYNAWKDRRNRVEVGQDFTEKVMNQIHQYEQKKTIPSLRVQRLVELISIHPLAKVGVAAAGAVVGAIRIALVFYAFLGC